MDPINALSPQWRSAPSPGGTGAPQTTALAHSTETPASGAVETPGQNRTVGAAAGAEQSNRSGNPGQDPRQVKDAVNGINDFLQNVNRSLQFKIDEDSGRVVVQIKDTETDEVIRQIPSEEALEIAKKLDQIKGLLVKEQA